MKENYIFSFILQNCSTDPLINHRLMDMLKCP